jgi:bacillithiol system protein YtxJ
MGWFSSNKNESALNWEHLSLNTNWNSLISTNDWIVIFKHSNRCGISSMALKQFEREWGADSSAKLYMIDVVKERSFSRDVADITGVTHQSPQLLLLKNGEVVFHASHYQIDANSVMKIINEKS